MNTSLSTHEIMKRIASYIKNYWKYLTFSIISASFFGIFAAIPSYVVQFTVDKVFVERTEHLLVPFVLLFVALFILKGIFMYLSQYYMHFVGFRVVNDIRNDLFKKILSFPATFFSKTSSGTLMSYFFNDIIIVQNTMSAAIRNGIRSIFESTFLLCIAFMQSWKLSLMMLIVGPAIGLAIRKTSSAVRSASRNAHDKMGELSSSTQEVLIGIREVKAHNAEHFEAQRFAKRLTNYFSFIMESLHFGALAPALIEIIAMSGIGSVLYIASREVLNGTMTPGQLTSFFSAILLAYQPLKKVITIYADIHYGISAADRIFCLMDQTFSEQKEKVALLKPLQKQIVFNNLSFSYTPNSPLLSHVSFTINKGAAVGIIGPSGSGKSTICDLLLGFLTPTDGSIKIDKQSIETLKETSLRSRIGYVGQSMFLFNDTIFENVAYGKINATQKDVEKACKAAHAHEFIEKFSDGYQTMVGENGANLSGGQKQRITIARALIKEPDILIFDEATSALDASAEMSIKQTISELKGKKTIIVISHRPSLLENLDAIYKISNKTLEIVSQHHIKKDHNATKLRKTL